MPLIALMGSTITMSTVVKKLELEHIAKLVHHMFQQVLAALYIIVAMVQLLDKQLFDNSLMVSVEMGNGLYMKVGVKCLAASQVILSAKISLY